MAKIGFIGMGNMGYAMLKGMLPVFDRDNLIFTDASLERIQDIHKLTNVNYAESNAECANKSDIIVLAVKPQFYDNVINNIKYIVDGKHIIISLAPGISIHDLHKKFEFDARIVRVMPNTPALIGEGITGVTYDKGAFTNQEEELIQKIFNSIGTMKYVDEKLMSAIVCASGSSPAYVYMFIEALADSVVKYGMPRDLAYEFVANSVMGSAKMVLETKEHPGALKDKVCSPGGTTIAAVSALEENGFRNALFKATEACYNKCENI